MTPMSFCQLVEGRLGWSPGDFPPDVPGWQRYRAEAGKVQRKMRQDPARYTWRNLKLAVEFLRRQHLTRTPIGVFAYVDAALAKSAVPETQIEGRIQAAIAAETAQGDPDGWAARLMRVHHSYRLEALVEWEAARG